MAEKKSQHYVPQMYFRNFSDNGKSIGGYIFKDHKYIENMSISGICKRDYLYGDDLQVEKWFSGLEAKWSPILNKIIRQGNLNLLCSEWLMLLEFIFLSDARTAYTADASDDFTTKVAQAVALTGRKHGDARFAQYTDEQIKKLKMGMNIPNAPSIRAMKKTIQILSDLVPVLIHNISKRQFITSDNPVVKYNYLFAKRSYPRNFGYGQVGAMVFLPISPSYCIIAYDPYAYRTATTSDVLEIKTANHIIELNRLFAVNAKSAIYFHNSTEEWVLDKYTQGIHDTSNNFNNRIFENARGDYLILSSNPSIQKKFRLDFLEINPYWLRAIFPNNLVGPLRSTIQGNNQIDKVAWYADRKADSLYRYWPDFE